MGYSVGHWEGDMLIVDTVGIEPRTWVDMGGHPHSQSMQERYRRPSRELLELQVTLTDPEIYAKPVATETMMHVLNVERSTDEKLETFCVPSEEQDFNKNIRDPAGGVINK